MKALLVRIGVDHSFGKWNAPVDSSSGRFAYVPIPEMVGTQFHPNCRRPYSDLLHHVHRFVSGFGLDATHDLKLPSELNNLDMHLDPDFGELTYGDNGNNRGKRILDMKEDDLLVFYAGLRDVISRKLVYAIVGLYVIKTVELLKNIPPDRWHENAHTRKLLPELPPKRLNENTDAPKLTRAAMDVIVRAKRGVSGRLEHCIPIGSYRDNAYRVTPQLLDDWGGLSVNDGYIQRSAVPPYFNNAERFYEWFKAQEPVFHEANF